MKKKYTSRKKEVFDETLRWSDIPYLAKCKVSDTGLIWSGHASRCLTTTLLYGRKVITPGANRNKGNFFVCEIVAKAFVPNHDPEKYKFVYFKDGNELNDDYRNLQWSTNPYSLDEGVNWVPLPKAPESHEISNLGIRPIGSRNLNPYLNSKGYSTVRLFSARHNLDTSALLHVEMARAFIPNPHNKPYVNHKNGIKTDWRLENLEWSTVSENALHAFATGLNSKKRVGTEIEEFTKEGIFINYFHSYEELGLELRISGNTVRTKVDADNRDKIFVINSRYFKIKLPPIIEGEIWKPVNTVIPYYNKKYEVSNKGRVRKVKDGKHLALQPSGKYLAVHFSKDSKSPKASGHLVHRLVAFAFLAFTDRSHDVNHKNKNEIDNFLENLEILDQAEHKIRDHGLPIIGVKLDGSDLIGYRSASCAAKIHENTSLLFAAGKDRYVDGYYWYFLNSPEAKQILEGFDVEAFVDHDSKCVVFIDKTLV